MDRKALLTAILCLLVAMPLCMTAISDDSDAYSADVNGVYIHSFDDEMEISAGNTYSLRFTLSNPAGPTKYVSISDVGITDGDMGTIKHNEISPLGSENTTELVFTINIYKYADDGEHDFEFTITVCDSDDTSNIASLACSFPLVIKSQYASGDAYNKFMGIIPNTLPEPFDSSTIAAIVSLIIWLFIAAVVGHIVYKFVDRKWSKNNEENSKDAKSLGKMITFLIGLIGLSQCLKIIGANEFLTGMVTDIITVVFIIIGAYIAWRAFKIVLYNVIVRFDRGDRIDDSLIPLFKMIGRIVICVVALSTILNIFGFDLAAIVTSAGLVSLAISLGAQETLNQFFCGIQLMATRPFRIGDKVRLGTDPDVLIVRKIRVMDTEFKNWLNEEVFRVPNSKVMSSMITNITYNDKSYKIYEYIDVDYGADIDKAKEIMLSIVSAHPQVITDGSKDMPAFRFYSMDASSIRLRVTYVLTDHELSYTVPCQIREAIYRKLHAEGIKVPHNIVDVHMEG